MRDWSRERWRRLYLVEALEKRAWRLLTRALEPYLVKLAQDDGRLAATFEGLVDALQPHDDERPSTELALSTLLDDGFLEERPDGVYVANLPVAQGDAPPPPKSQSAPKSTPKPPTSTRWSNTTKTDRSAAAKKAAEARWGAKTGTDATHAGDASDALPDASTSHATSHSDASDDASGDASSVASGPRAVSGQVVLTEELFQPTNHNNQMHARERDASGDAYATSHSDAPTHDASSHQSSQSHSAHDASKKLPCPANLKLTKAQSDNLAMNSCPLWAQEQITREFVVGFLADPNDQRPLVAWQKCLAKAVAGRWSDSSKRPKKPEEAGPNGGPPPASQDAIEASRRALAAREARVLAQTKAELGDTL